MLNIRTGRLSSPYVHSKQHSSKIMLWVILALLIAVVVKTYYFGFGVVIELGISLLVAIFIDILIAKMRSQSCFSYLKDLTSVVSAVIFALSIPAYLPFWVNIIGISFGLIFAKYVYGGLGQNQFNPAMIGFVAVLIGFPGLMSQNLVVLSDLGIDFKFMDAFSLIFSGVNLDGLSLEKLNLLANSDALSGATPLNALKIAMNAQTSFNNSGLFHGFWQVNLAYITGAILLILLKVIRLYIPVLFILTYSILTLIAHLIAPENFMALDFMLLNGSVFMGAFFIVTDPVGTPTELKGKLIYVCVTASLLWVIRNFSSFPDGMAFAVLLGNILVPLIDHYIAPIQYKIKDKHE